MTDRSDLDASRVRALLQRLHDAAYAAGGDERTLREILTEDVRWHIPGENAIAGDYVGIDETLAYFERRRKLVTGVLQLEVGQMMVGSTHVAVLTDGRATRQGVEHHWSTVGLYRIRDARIAECWLLALDQDAFDRAWS